MNDSADTLSRMRIDERVVWTDHIDQFRHLSNAHTDGIIWHRMLPERVTSWLNLLPAARLPEGRMLLRPEQLREALDTLFERACLERSEERDWLSQDIGQLAAVTHRVSGKPWLRLRLEPVTNNACSKFHVDYIDARLICTYRGPGSQLSMPAQNNEPENIFEVPTGQPILLKGRLWTGNAAPHLRHRSPPISGTGLTRLLLVLEGVSDTERLDSQYDEVLDPS